MDYIFLIEWMTLQKWKGQKREVQQPVGLKRLSKVEQLGKKQVNLLSMKWFKRLVPLSRQEQSLTDSQYTHT